MEQNMFREPHWLTANHGQRMPERVMFVAFDFDEVYTNEQKTESRIIATRAAYCVGRYAKGKMRSFTGPSDCGNKGVFEYIYAECRRKRPLYVVLFNPRRDCSVSGLSDEIRGGRIRLAPWEGVFTSPAGDRSKMGRGKGDFAWLESGRGIAVFHHGQSRIILLGLGNFVDYEEDITKPCCKRVVELATLFTNYLSFITEHNCGQFSLTAAAQSLRCYRHYHKTCNIHIHGNTAAYNLESTSLRGGREQVLYYGQFRGRLYLVDVCSMYGYAMRGRQFPTTLINHEKFPNRRGFSKEIEEGSAIARVVVKTKDNVYPYYDGKRIIYPEGEYVTTLAGPELRQAHLAGEIKHVGEIATYKMADLFSHYCNYWWDHRLRYRISGDLFGEALCKSFLTRFWGKWAQKASHWCPYDSQCPFPDVDNWWEDSVTDNTKESCRDIGAGVEHEIKGFACYDTFPGIAAFVTSYARIYLDELIRAAGYRHCYLAFVDSLIVDSTGLENLDRCGYLAIDRLGSVRIQSTSEGATFYGATDLVWNGHHKICGVPKEADQISEGVFRVKLPARVQTGTDLPQGSGHDFRYVDIKLNRARPENFVQVDDWLGPVKA